MGLDSVGDSPPPTVPSVNRSGRSYHVGCDKPLDLVRHVPKVNSSGKLRAWKPL